ncbi:N-acetyl-gamma-glutamyl-phosphate reductase [Rhodoligotrophos appendicifer]|uniref:N-acetyl-gamma-glutamyl-phosphate reductase n=1 Tax=Rhodoligotrophos appendicifer TaxID=987056 RepID=UPI001184B28E|nr:N-acetyl-gamma-glutamyl-phosphate reductase [Rhodoligotrophos appendicifer]
MSTKIFIDGEAGTTGLQIRSRLDSRTDLEMIRLEGPARKDESARREAINESDIVILCLPDEAAREAVSLIARDHVRVIDASTAYRTAQGWVYGFPEMAPGQHRAIAAAQRVTNPGCYPTGAIALLRPLVEHGIVPKGWPVTVNAVSGYSGGGKSLIAAFEDPAASNHTTDNFRIYALGLGHKHIAEMQLYCDLHHPPLFAPSVGRFAQGMIVEVPLQLWALPGATGPDEIRDILEGAYRDSYFVEVASREETEALSSLDPERLNGTNRLKLFVFGNEELGQARLVALLDNLGKGASGQAVQNLNIMIGVDEATGL